MINKNTKITAVERLNRANLRPTRQRVALLNALMADGDRHVCPELLHAEARKNGIRVSIATVYNTLNQFTDSGLLRKVTVNLGQSYFDTNLEPHHHFYDEVTGELTDIPLNAVLCPDLPEPPAGKQVQSVDIVVRVH